MKKQLKYDLSEQSCYNPPESAFDIVDILIIIAVTIVLTVIFQYASYLDKDLGMCVFVSYLCIAALLSTIMKGIKHE